MIFGSFQTGDFADLAFARVVLPSLAVSACTTVADQPVVAPEAAAHAFLNAFDSLDTVRFDAFFGEEVTMFFPGGPFPKERVEGKQEVTAAFRKLFDAAKERGTTRLGLEPQDLKVQHLGDFAIASFHLRGKGNIGRRSILFRREGAYWHIVHFHASALPQDQ
ncbi:YybH family protein [Tsuneonella sp. HG249]